MRGGGAKRFAVRPQAALWALGVVLLCTCAAGAAGDTVRVRRVFDGDTVELQDGRRVRYVGIDAPETAHEERPAEPLAEAARAFNRRLVGKGALRLETDVEPRDRFGRLLGYLYLADGTLVNARLVEEGLAVCLPSPPNTRHRERLREAQRQAMSRALGIWRDWREPAAGPYRGNHFAGRFHRADCPGAARIHPRRRIPFATQWEAYWAGHAPAGDCLKIRPAGR